MSPNPYTHGGRVNGTTYYYVMTAQNAWVKVLSQARSQPPRPTAISAHGVNATSGNGQVTISWNGIPGHQL